MADVGVVLSKIRALGADVVIDQDEMTIVGSIHLNDEQRAWIASNRDPIEQHLRRARAVPEISENDTAPFTWGQFARILHAEAPKNVDPCDWSWFVSTAGRIVRGEVGEAQLLRCKPQWATTYATGTLALTNGSVDVVLTGGLASPLNIREGDVIIIAGGEINAIADIADLTHFTLARAYAGATGANKPYVVVNMPTGWGDRVALAEEVVQLIREVEKVDAYFDVQVALLADRAAFDTRQAGFRVLVSNTGDGRSAIYSKQTSTSGDWSAPAYLTGPGSTVPGPPGVVWRGAYDAGTAYAINDAVTFNSSSFRKLTGSAAGTAPSNATPPVSNANWEVLAAKATGDFAGPASSTDNGIVGFNGTSGKSGKQLTPAQVRAAGLVPVGEYRNLLINPLFDHNQRLVSGTVSLAAGAYGHDRMKAGSNGCTYTFSTTNGVTVITITAGSLRQIIEAGAFAGRAGSYVASWVGTAQANINGGAAGASGAVSAVCDGSANVYVEWGPGTLSLPQFEKDYVTPFSARGAAHEDDMCFRYAERLSGVIYAPSPAVSSGPTKYSSWFFKTRKRVVPTMSALGTAYGVVVVSIDRLSLGSTVQDEPLIPDGAFASAEL